MKIPAFKNWPTSYKVFLGLLLLFLVLGALSGCVRPGMKQAIFPAHEVGG